MRLISLSALPLFVAPALMVSAAPALGQSLPKLSVHGACPSADQLTAALAKDPALGSERYRVRVRPTIEGASLRVSGPGLPSPWLVRIIDSTDCAAIADAFALIISSNVRAAQVAPPPLPSPSPAKDNKRARRRVSSLSMVRSPPSAQPEATVQVPDGLRRSAPRASVGFSAGVDAALAPGANVSFAEIDLTLFRGRYGLRAAAAVNGTSMHTDATPFFRSQRSAAIQAVRRSSWGKAWLLLGGGAGVVDSTVTTNAGVVRRLHLTLIGAVLAGRQVTNNVSLRTEMSGHLYPVADTYVSTMQGIVGRSPQATLRFSAGMVIDF